jgi:type IV pilus assembly protein PilV
MTHRAKKYRGFTMLEVLVAIVIMSIGVFGLASLQITAKRTNFEAVQQATATFLVQELIERMRANPNALSTYTDDGLGRVLTGASLTATNCDAGCQTAEMALFDLYQWEQAVSGANEKRSGTNTGGLPSMNACVTGPAGGSGNYFIAIAWRGSSDLIDPTTSTCGQGSGLYDSDLGSDVRRRVLIVETFIAVPV